MVQNGITVLQSSFWDIWLGFAKFVPNFVVAVIIFLAGWLLGSVIGKVVSHIIASLKVDHALRGVQVDHFVKRAGFDLDAGAFIGGLVEWFIIIVFLVASLEVLGLSQVNAFLVGVVLDYLPRVITASIIILVAAVIAETMQKVVTGVAAATGIRSANFAGTVTRWAIWIFALFIALDHLGIGGPLLPALFQGIVVAFSIAFGLSFGLGGQDAAASFIGKVRQEIADRHNHA